VLHAPPISFFSICSPFRLITDGSETLWLDNWESEVAGGTCRTADRGDDN
jgi:hypothetical protein